MITKERIEEKLLYIKEHHEKYGASQASNEEMDLCTLSLKGLASEKLVEALKSIHPRISNKDVSFAAYKIIDSIVDEALSSFKSEVG